MAEEFLVVLSRSENLGFGFTLLGQQGSPHIIYRISEDSPAAESGKVKVGDVIIKVNETDVIDFSTKEVLRCLRLSSDPVTLKIKRDPNIKATFQKHLMTPGGDGEMVATNNKSSNNSTYAQTRPEPAVHRTNGSCADQPPILAQNNDRLDWQPLGDKPKGQPKFEAFMMTGEHILNISRTAPQTNLTKQLKKVDHPRFHNSHAHHLRHQQHNSVPNSPNEMDMGHRGNHRSGPNSANTSPVSANKRDSNPSPSDKTFSNFVRTSRSEDQLQDTKSISAVDIDVDDDITSSLNTLLDTRPDAGSSNNVCTSSNSDRIVWTYNAPVTTSSEQNKLCQTLSNGSSSSPSTSPLRSNSPQSPTSVSSSVMSSHSGSRKLPYTLTNGPHTDSGQYNQTNGDFSVSEAISNISSPDYHDDDSSMALRDYAMEISDHSDSDSTLLVSEPRQRLGSDGDHRIVIQVKGPDKDSQTTVKDRGKQRNNENTFKIRDQQISDIYDYYNNESDVEDALLRDNSSKASSPPISEDDSDIESLHSFHLSPKAVDMPSAIRLANRLYNLDGFKKSDVSRHLSKNNEFSRAVADEYLKNFNFYKDILDFALRKFLKQFSLTGETQERERVLVHFSKRYLDCNPGSFNSQDAVHTLTCAIMLLNTDLHGQNMSRKMTCNEFIDNLAGLNEGEDFPREVLKELYHAIKNNPLEWALDEEIEDNGAMQMKPIESHIGGNPFLDVPSVSNSIEYKKGYVMRKCCYETNGKRTPFHKRSWKMFYCTLRDLVLYLHKDENGFRKNQMGDNLHNAIRIHHALATMASDYTKKQYVFRLQTSDQAEYLFQTSDLKELQSWIDTINFVCASFSAPPLEAAVGSQKKFQRPLLPCSHTKFNLREQLMDHEERVMRLERDLQEHQQMPPERGSKSLVIQNYKEREAYLNYELKRYKTYAHILRARIVSQYQELGVSLVETAIGELDEATGVTYLEGGAGGGVVAPPVPDRPSPQTNRYIGNSNCFPIYESPVLERKLVDRS